MNESGAAGAIIGTVFSTIFWIVLFCFFGKGSIMDNYELGYYHCKSGHENIYAYIYKKNDRQQ